ncbi:MAG: PEP-CTERM sorting domain-containing protein, partial [Lentimonas sp.]
MKISYITAVAAVAALTVTTGHAAVILAYDSLLVSSGGSADALSRINSVTDSAFVTSSQQFNTFGSKAVLASISTQTNVQGDNGDQGDMFFRFGSNTGGSGILSGALNAGHAASGPRIDFSYTAAQAQSLDEFSFHHFVNSNNASSTAARDVGLFVQVAGGGYTQFGNLYLTSARGNLGTVSFSGNLAIASGDLVEFRLAFTDRTRTNNDLQAATRIGDVQIFATVPEPGAYALVGGLLALTAVALRRRQS